MEKGIFFIAIDRKPVANDIIKYIGTNKNIKRIKPYGFFEEGMNPDLFEPLRIIVCSDEDINDGCLVYHFPTNDLFFTKKEVKIENNNYIKKVPITYPALEEVLSFNLEFVKQYADAGCPDKIDLKYQTPSSSFANHLQFTIERTTPLQLDSNGYVIANLIKQENKSLENKSPFASHINNERLIGKSDKA